MKKICFYILSIGTIFTFSCKDLLEQEPVSNLTQEDYWQTKDDATAGVVALYNGLQSMLSTNFLFWGDIRSDEVEFVQGESNPTAQHIMIMNNDLDANMGQADWTSLYNVIARSNNVIANVSQIDESSLSSNEKNNFLAQAYFVRALAYFYAIRVWGDVPLITRPYTSAKDDFFVTRTDQNTVLDTIKSDIEYAINYLPKSTNSARATWGAAMSLKAHVYAWTREYSVTSDATERIISSNLYNLVSKENYSDIFEKENSTESIFELQFNFASNQETNGISDLFMAQPYRNFIEPRFQPSDYLLNSFEPEDIRENYLFFRESQDYNGASPELIMKYFGSDDGNPSGQFRIADDNIILFRLSDIYLLKAEALNELGQTANSIQYLNTIRLRAGVQETNASTKEEVKFAILEERMRELCFEGHRFFDLIRNGVVLEVLDNLNSVDQLLWPIHQNRLIENPNLEQNEYYK
jgi:starch-binding outer membrane protein, SusD/RagB family